MTKLLKRFSLLAMSALMVFGCFAVSACGNNDEEPEEEEEETVEPVGAWNDGVWDYVTSDGEEAQMDYSLYIPDVYTEDNSLCLPLITYIPDSSYVGMPLSKYRLSECTKNWIVNDKIEENPLFCLVIRFTEVAASGGDQSDQVIKIIDYVVDKYKMDTDRLYLTGQSMGGIMDFGLNDAYPDKFAATVYVDCQPGASVGDAMYLSILENAKFINQKFVYISSMKDQPATSGMNAVRKKLTANGIEYGEAVNLDHLGGETLNAQVKDVLSQGYKHNFFGFTQVTSSGDSVAEHMKSFQYGYAIDAIFEWLLEQRLEVPEVDDGDVKEETPSIPESPQSGGTIYVQGTAVPDAEEPFDSLEITFRAGDAYVFIFNVGAYEAGQQFMLGCEATEDSEASFEIKEWNYWYADGALTPPVYGAKIMFEVPDIVSGPPITKLIIQAPENLEGTVTLRISVTEQTFNG